MIENKQVKILQDFYIHTERFIEATKQDITAVDKENNKKISTKAKEWLLIDVSVPGRHVNNVKEIEKLNKYTNIRIEVVRTGDFLLHHYGKYHQP